MINQLGVRQRDGGGVRAHVRAVQALQLQVVLAQRTEGALPHRQQVRFIQFIESKEERLNIMESLG